MIHGRLSPLNLDVSRFEREENSKEIDQVNEQDQEYSHDHYSTQENLNVVAQSMGLNKDDPSTKAASPNSNNILNLRSKKEEQKNNENDDENSSFIMYHGQIFSGVIKFFNQKNQFGFITQDEGDKDIFFHYEDIKSNMCPKKTLKNADKDFIIKVSYQKKFYVGKKKDSYKAVNIKVENISERS